MTDYAVDFQPIGRKGECRADETILACARRLGVDISSVCGGRGTCNSCRIRITSGALSEPTDIETGAFTRQELDNCWRLACQTSPTSDCQVEIPLESMTASQRVYIEELEIAIAPDPAVKAYHIQLTTPSLSDQRGDTDRVLAGLNEQHGVACRKIDINVLRALSPRLRNWNWECQTSVRHDEVVALGPWPSRQLGLAVDLGTTTIAGYLIDLNDGQTLAYTGAVNPQVNYGEDIISRIDYAIKSSDGEIKLHELAVNKLNEMVTNLCAKAGTSIEEIVEATVVCNTAMHHILLNLPVKQLVLTPFSATANLSLDVKAHELGLRIAQGAYIHFPPNISGFVGSDHVSMLLASNHGLTDGPVVALDIGTNTEISLLVGDEITTTSCASGPAFEGGHIKHGIRAVEGAIERLRITEDGVNYQTINKARPIGICGSGVLDALAQLYLAKIIDGGGRLAKGNPRVRVIENRAEFVLVDGEGEDRKSSIVITQKDVRELQLAKAAIRSSIQLLLEATGFVDEDISEVIIAGSFGSYIDVSSAITVGLLPALPLDRFHQVGNAAGMGAKLALVSLAKRKEAEGIASRTHYIELANASAFKQTFIETSHIGRYRIKQGKREAVT